MCAINYISFSIGIGESIEKIVKSSDEILSISRQVSLASGEQSTTVKHISEIIEGMNIIADES